MFHPITGALALSEHLFGIAVFTVPLHLAGLNAAAAYNVAVILTVWLSGYFAFLFGRRITGSALGGWVCGFAFALAPYRAGQLAHLQVLAAHWMPLALFAMHRYLGDPRRRWLALAGAAWVLQALSNGYYLLFFPVLIGAWLLWFGRWRQKCALSVTFVLSSLLLVPTLLQYREVHALYGLERDLGEMRMFSARPSSFLQVPDLVRVWPELQPLTPEGHLFPGLTPIVVVLAGAILLVIRRQLADAWRRRSPALFYSAGTLLFWWLSFGPAEEPTAAGLLSHPYTILTCLPGFSGLRVPARFAMLATLCLAAAAAFATVRLAAQRPRRRIVLGSVVLAGLVLEGWIEPMPLVPVPSRFLVPESAEARVLELPLDDAFVSVSAMYRQIDHRHPLINGYSGHIPPHYPVLARALRRGDPSALHILAADRPLIILIHRRADREGEWRQFVESAGAVLHEETGLGPVMLLPRQPRERVPPPGDPIPAASIPSEAGSVAVDLGREATVRAITIEVEDRYEEIAGRSLVEVSQDGETWTGVWEGWTGGRAVAGILDDPKRAPLVLPLPDVRARYLRFSPAPPWVGEKLRIDGVR